MPTANPTANPTGVRISVSVDTHALETAEGGGSTLIWKDLSVQVHAKKNGTKQILDKVSGYIEPGEILYIIGPSGSGKSTLLDALANRLKLQVNGVQQLNGQSKSGKSLKRCAKYVQQHDDLLGILSVKESLTYSARLYGVEDYETAVDQTIDVLGLRDHKNTKIGNVFMKGLSGGQKRRVSIGCELVAKPQLLFLDEPSSGLDSATAYNVMKELKNIAQQTNIAMIITIHQPSQLIFEMANKLMMISEGKMCYFGNASTAKTHFQSLLNVQKPTDLSDVEWLSEIINKDFGETEIVGTVLKSWNNSKPNKQLQYYLNTNLKTESENKDNVQTETNVYATDFFTQTYLLVQRGVLNAVRNPAVLWLRFSMYVMLAVLIGLVWLRLPLKATSISEMNAAIFYICGFMIFMSISVLPAYLEERELLSRERSNSAYSSSAYIISHTLYEIPFLLLLSFVCSLVVYFMVGLTLSWGRFFIFVLNLFTSLLVAESMMVLISAIMPIVIVGIAAGAMVFGLFMCVMGLFVRLNDIGWWIRWMQYISVHYYSYSTFLVNQYRGVTYKAVPDSIFPPFPNDVPGEDVYRDIGLEERIWVNFLAQIAMIIILRVAAIAWIHRFVKGKK